tara:strand:+ start:1164 stop:1892 length:729 start_codon:yes stop_codon:yes gene_type:complete
MELHGMADELTREGVTQRLEEIFAAALDGDELEKLISSIPKRLDKYEGRWDGLIGWAEKKYGKPETDESEEKPTKKKRGGMFSRLGKSKKEDDPPQDTVEGEPQDEGESEEEGKPTKKKRGGLFSRLGKSKEEAEPTEADDPDDSEEAVEESIDEPEEATDDEQADEEHDDAADLEGDEAPLEKAARLLEGGDSEGALEVWKGLVRSDGGNPGVWRGLASYFASAGRPGRAQACEEHADELP